LAVSEDGTLKLFDYVSLKELKSLSKDRGEIIRASFSSDSKNILFSKIDSSFIIEISSWSISKKFEGSYAAYSFNSDKLFVNDSEGFVRIYDIENGDELYSLQIDDFIFNHYSDKRYLLLSGFDKTYIFDNLTYDLVCEADGLFSDITNDGKYFCTQISLFEGGVNIYETSTGKKLKSIKIKDRLYSPKFSPDSKYIIGIETSKEIDLFNNDYSITQYDISTGLKKGEIFKSKKIKINSASYSPDGKMLQITCDNKTVFLFDLLTKKSLEIKLDFTLNESEFSKDSRLLIIKPFKTTAGGIGPKKFAIFDCIKQKIKIYSGKMLRLNYSEFNPNNNNLLLEFNENSFSLIDLHKLKVTNKIAPPVNQNLAHQELWSQFSPFIFDLYKDVNS
jgi:WD40 repeat protein